MECKSVDPIDLKRVHPDAFSTIDEFTWSKDRRIDDIRSVGRANDEDILLRAHTVHLGQNLIDHTVSSTTTVPNTSASSFR